MQIRPGVQIAADLQQRAIGFGLCVDGRKRVGVHPEFDGLAKTLESLLGLSQCRRHHFRLAAVEQHHPCPQFDRHANRVGHRLG
ncbi:hypothetical protein D3C85_1744580 [compost metagenome]